MTGLLSYMLPHRGVQWELAKSPSVPQLAIREQLDREMSYDGSHPRQQEQEAINAFRGYGPQMLADAFIPGYGAGGDAKAASEAYGEGRYGAAAGNALMAAMDFVPVLGALPAAAKGIRAFHGSPHDFDRFDMSKIGTGEGAQAYGHGLYFAENEAVARGYRDALSRELPPKYKGMTAHEMQTFTGAEDMAARSTMAEIAAGAADVSSARVAAERQLKKELREYKKIQRETGSSYVAGAIKRTENEILALRSLKDEDFAMPSPGRMYEVNINADPEAFLDWDKPLSEQPANVRDLMAKERDWRRSKGFAVDDSNSPAGRLDQGTLTGADVANWWGRDTSPLRDAGIPGIKYLDAGSRGAGDGSRNYVVFDDRLITILRKYGIGGLIAGGGAYALTDAEYAQAAELLAQDGTGAQ